MTTGGLSSKGLARVRDVLQRCVDSGFAPGAVAVVARRGEVHVEAVGNLAFEGSVGLRSVYGLKDFRVVPLQFPVRYPSLDDGKVDVLAVFTTEGQLSAGRYRVLSDPRNLFAFQNLAPVIRRDLARKYGARLTGPLDSLSKRLTTDVMRRMNAAVDLKGEKPAAVADRFIKTGTAG